MGPGRETRQVALVAKTRAELEGLAARGVLMCGNAFAAVLLVKGLPAPEEAAPDGLFSGADGKALRAALQALGYAPQDWAGLACWDEAGDPLDAATFREALCALDPATVVLCDAPAADLMREAYAADLAMLDNFDEAMLTEGMVATVAGVRVMALGGFAAALGSQQDKQLMWHRLKSLPPLGEPY